MGKIEIQPSLILDSLAKRRRTVLHGDKQAAAAAAKTAQRDTLRQISGILRKPTPERSASDQQLLDSSPQLVKHARKLQDRVDQSKQRLLEQEDPYDVIDAKARQLADLLSRARHLVCYTGAGISTAARIPDYRGSNGIWTRLQKGEAIGQHDLSQAEPTFTHMALFELHRQRILQYVLSQNCDGLHLRSGLPREALSEVHGNMYVEVCKACKPNREYLRVFDCTELTARYCHKTNRRCHECSAPLVDTIVHFGERGSLKWPLNWDGSSRHSERADVILCLGSSLKVLKKYSWLWQMDRPRGKRPKLCIVNLQWTPKDAFADLKVNGKCDAVMALVMRYMGIAVRRYSRLRDPIFAHATRLTEGEEHTVTQPMLKWEDAGEEEEEEETTTADDDDEDDESFEEEENCGEEAEAEDGRLAGEEDSDSECSESCQCDQLAAIKSEPVDEKPELKCTIKTEIKQETTDTIVKSENGDAIKLEAPPNGVIKLENPAENGAKAATVTILISDSEESMSSASATTTSSSADSAPPLAQQRIRLPTVVRTPPPPPPPPPVPHFTTSPLGLRTISPQRKPSDPPKVATTSAAPEPQPPRLPYWYEPSYVYSGLHTLVHPAPNDVHLFRTTTKSALQLDASRAECQFCFANYAENRCLFYRPAVREHVNGRRTRSGRLIVCECCAGLEKEETEVKEPAATEEATTTSAGLSAMLADDTAELNEDSLLALLNDDEEAEQSTSAEGEEQSAVQTDDSGEMAGGDEKRLKLEEEGAAGGAGAAAQAAARIQPGWYGKGYRKSRRRRRM